MRDFIFYAAVLTVLSAGRCALSEDHKDPRCGWVSPYKNTIQHDMHREWKCRP